MDKGGERAERERDGNTGWESVAALASQAPDENQELKDDTETAISTESETKKVGGDELEWVEIEKMFRREAFTNVSSKEIERTIGKFVDSIDGDKLLELQQAIAEDLKGVEVAEEYFTKLLGLKMKPVLREEKLPDSTLAVCSADFDPDVSDVISYDRDKLQDNIEQFVLTLAHENWHSFQNQEIRGWRNRTGTTTPGWRAGIYAYNNANYISSADDFYGYRSQLLEAEAYTFEDKLKVKMRNAKTLRAVKEHPEIYGDENIPGIEQEMQKVFQDFDVKLFLKKMGVKTLSDFFEKTVGNDSEVDVEDFVKRYLGVLKDLADVKHDVNFEMADLEQVALKAILVDEVDLGEIEAFSDMLRVGRNIYLGQGKKDLSGIFLMEIPKIVWGLRQEELMKDLPDSERAQMYLLNKENMIDDNYYPEMAEKQLLSRERKEFAERLKDILDEQATVEEVEQMPLLKRVLARIYMRRKDVLPLSKKYQVKRSK